MKSFSIWFIMREIHLLKKNGTIIFYNLSNKTQLRQKSEICIESVPNNSNETYTYYVWAEPPVLGSTKTALKFKYEI
jgi:hypothetical protein